MAFLVALAAVAITWLLAYRGFLHPLDYVVEAGLALELAVFVVVLTPTAAQHALLAARGAPAEAIDRSAFLLANGVSIELAATLVALGALAAALIRRRTFDAGELVENHG
ncbi:MAG: hypothetical protein R2708_07185 [Vicinamibacterales bacterium]